MLLGHWKNIEELEESLCLSELELIVQAARDKEHRSQKFFAALKGVDLDAKDEEAKRKFEEIKRRADAKVHNKTREQQEREELAEFGLDVM